MEYMEDRWFERKPSARAMRELKEKYTIGRGLKTSEGYYLLLINYLILNHNQEVVGTAPSVDEANLILNRLKPRTRSPRGKKRLVLEGKYSDARLEQRAIEARQRVLRQKQKGQRQEVVVRKDAFDFEEWLDVLDYD